LREQIALFRALESRRNDGALHPWIQSASAQEDRLASAEGAARLGRVRRHRRVWSAPAVLVFILLNIAAFLFEISFGDWTAPETLHRLGALEPYAVVTQGEYWRLFTALFYTALRPPPVQSFCALRSWPAPGEINRRSAIHRLLFNSGFGSSAGVVLLTVLGLVHVAQLVGASGCVMGIVGAWRTLASTSSRAAREAAFGQHHDDHRDSGHVRSLDAAGEHGGSPLRIDHGICCRACARATENVDVAMQRVGGSAAPWRDAS